MVVINVAVTNCQPQTIVIGRRGTYDTMQIAFDLSFLTENYGNGTAVLAIKRSQDESAYPAVVTQEDSTLLWTVSETDTAYVGSGECQLMWYVDGGLAKTIIYPMVVMRDILTTAEEPPDGYENWIEHLTGLGAETQQNAQNAAQSASEAEQAKDDAVDAKEASEEAARKATAASVHAPIIQNGYWYIWNDGQYVDTGVHAEGQKGDKGDTGEKGDTGNGIESITKTGTSGLVDTYTVTYTDGTSTTFTVTNGAKGDKGDTGATGNGIASIEKTGTSGNVDTYTITYTNGQTVTFTVTNGAVSSVAGKTGAVVLDSGDIAYDESATYQAGSVGAELQEQNRQISDVEENKIPELKIALSQTKDKLGKAVITVKGINICDTSDSVTGALQSDGTIATNGIWANYKTTDYLPVEMYADYVCILRNSNKSVNSGDRKIIAFYDADKNLISNKYINTYDETYKNFNTDNAVFIRASALNNLILQICYGSGLLPYSDYEPQSYDFSVDLKDYVNTRVLETESEFGTPTNNILDLSKVVTVGAIGSDGSINTNGSWGNYITSDFIKIEKNTAYVFILYRSDLITVSNERKLVLPYDEEQNPISTGFINSSGVQYVTFNSGNAQYVRVSYANEAYFALLSKGNSLLPYTLYGYQEKSNVLSMKKWAVCGDSFTNGATNNVLSDGTYKGQKIVYPYIIGNRNDMIILKFFEGGQTLAFPANPSTFTNSLTYQNNSRYYQNIPADVDYITIYLGINDSHHETGQGGDGEDPTGIIPLGSIDDSTTATYYGAWNVVLTWLIANRPFAHIGIIVSNGCDREAYRTAQLEIARKYGIPFIDLNGDDRTPVMIRSLNPNIADAVKSAVTQKQAVSYPSNTHPNDDAHLYESYFIENFLRTL